MQILNFFKNNISDIILFLGYFASFLIFATFYMHGEFKIRSVAITSNIIGIIYSFLAYNNGMHAILPILILHTCLLPINLVRLKKLHNKLTIEQHDYIKTHNKLKVKHLPACNIPQNLINQYTTTGALMADNQSNNELLFSKNEIEAKVKEDEAERQRFKSENEIVKKGSILVFVTFCFIVGAILYDASRGSF